MAPPLPPDLDRVGDDLVAAAALAIDRRGRRRRLIARAAGTGAAAMAALAWLVPATLGPAERSHDMLLARSVSLVEPARPAACDLPRGGRPALPACQAGEPIPLGRPGRW
jgi:hypothetical protein